MMKLKHFNPIPEKDVRVPIHLFTLKKNHVHQVIAKHWHEGAELIYCHKGENNIWIEGQTYRIGQGDCLFINPYTLHETIQVGDSELYILQIPRSFLEECRICLDYEIHFNSLLDDDKDYSFIQKILPEMQAAQLSEDVFSYLKINGLFSELMYRLLHEFASPITHQDYDFIKKEQHVLFEILVYIRENFSGYLSQQETAEHFGYNAQYFARFFKAQTGSTFLEYVNSLQVEAAQKLLLTTDLKIIDISEQCGFRSVKALNRSFSRCFGMTPGKYRRLEADGTDEQLRN
ncbi:helix-turn-helix transcriptional regulator [Enterococcus sp. BWR-S5]|uniref:helix-turn-helix transcriptional regulator n=1 Tax=Enterococcus sp. BWR-S5 TaxID=2787714 RepID=UPI0019216B3B|nr:helix-turn-helix domain-containing protein [Enterococcus sp. BWR-S5]MBL1226645.1 AraC family transcriptional regulator [Enterococcus sp. BWR-S5]